MSIASLAHACIKTTDLEKTTAFYCGALGMKKHFDFVKAGKVVGSYYKADNNTFVEVFLADAAEHLDKRCLHHFCLETADLEGLHKRIVEHGYEPGKIIMGADHTPQFWMTDPNGLDVEFQQYTPESCQHTGVNVEVNW